MRAFIATKPCIILGSNSASRKTIFNELARNYQFQYEVIPAGIDEKSIRRDDPKDLVVTLGYEKAKAVTSKIPQDKDNQIYIITGDQVVVHENRILEKPTSANEIRTNIRRFAETPASTVGSLVCTHLPTYKQIHSVDIATIYMNSIPETIVERLIQEGDVFHSAGGLLAEHPLVTTYVEKIDGGLDAIMGMSKDTIASLLVDMWKTITSHSEQKISTLSS